MKYACFDLTGTLIHHETRRPIPLMPELLRSLHADGWSLWIVTAWGERTASRLMEPVLEASGLSRADVRIEPSSDKARSIGDLLRSGGERVMFVDDKPRQFESVARLGLPNRSVWGFLGSRKYAPGAAGRAWGLGIPYALTAIELAEELGVRISLGPMGSCRYTVDELIDLIPGLKHPCSSFGEDCIFDHRSIVSRLPMDLESLGDGSREKMWENLAWVRCDECIWKWMVRLAISECGLQPDRVLGDAYKAHEYVRALEGAEEAVRGPIVERLYRGLDLMRAGVHRIVDESVIDSRGDGGSRLRLVRSSLESIEARVSTLDRAVGRAIAIGDIHGDSRALARLIEEICPTADDTLVVLGDVIDRGPDSRGVIDQLLELDRRCTLILLMGNHEEMLLAALEGRDDRSLWLRLGGRATLDSYGITRGDPNEIPRSHLEFLKRARPYHESDTHIFVHAGYDPERPLSDQSSETRLWKKLDPAQVAPHRSGKVAVVGHTPQTGVLDLGFLKCIDTGCGCGGGLTALDVSTGRLFEARGDGDARGETRK